jgi:hypothetical protein
MKTKPTGEQHAIVALAGMHAHLIDLLRRADVYIVTHIVAGKGMLDELQEEGGDCRDVVDDINEAEALRAEVLKVLSAVNATTEGELDDVPL